MTREDILKELELWPLWTLKQPFPQQTSLLITPEKPVDSMDLQPSLKQEENHPPLISHALSIGESTSYPLKVVESEDGRCLMVHADLAFSKEEDILWRNMLKAMGFKEKLIGRPLLQDSLLEARSHQHLPVVIILFGEKVAHTVLQSHLALADLRGKSHFYQDLPCVVTYKIAHLLQYAQDKANAWDDLRLALALLAKTDG